MGADGNIKVVVRCRGRSERERLDGSAVVVSSDGARSTELTVETAAAPVGVSAAGVSGAPTTRMYPFDIVFGSDADQALLYQEVVAPMLEEVLHGYNCTLFAYGQTGTGKT
jgi:kinesin family protein 11